MKLKRYPKEVLAAQFNKEAVADSTHTSEPHQMVFSTEESLRQVTRNYNAFIKSIDAFGKAWSEDENLRNRPERQKLTNDLCCFVPNGIKFADIVSKIEKATNLSVLD